MLVDIIPFPDIRFHLFVSHFFPLLDQLLVAPLGPYFRTRRHKELHLCMREHDTPYIPSIHDHAPLFCHFPLLLNKQLPHVRQRGNQTHVIRNLQPANGRLYILAIHVRFITLLPLVIFKTENNGRKHFFQFLIIHVPVFNQPLTHRFQRHDPVHGTRVDIRVTQTSCQYFRYRAFSRRRMAVNGNNQTFLFHFQSYLFRLRRYKKRE